jgi:hypothetical protein
MKDIKFDLVIRLDESGDRLLFFACRSSEVDRTQDKGKSFNVDIPLDELRSRGGNGAELMIGESVLGFFDHLTDGRLDLPKHYLEDS